MNINNILFLFYLILFIVDFSLVYQILSIKKKDILHKMFVILFVIWGLILFNNIIYITGEMFGISIFKSVKHKYISINNFVFPQLFILSLFLPFKSRIVEKVKGIWYFVFLPYVLYVIITFFRNFPAYLSSYIKFLYYSSKEISPLLKVTEEVFFYIFKFVEIIYIINSHFVFFINLGLFILTLVILIKKIEFVYIREVKKQTIVNIIIFFLMGMAILICNLNYFGQFFVSGLILIVFFISIFLFYYNSVRYNFLKLPLVFKKGIFFALIFLFIYLIYFTWYDSLKKYIVIKLGYQAPFIDFGILFFSLLIIPLLLNFVDLWMDRILVKQSDDLKINMQFLAREIMGKFEIDEVLNTIGSIFEENLTISNVCIVLLSNNRLVFHDYATQKVSEYMLNQRESLNIKSIALSNDYIEIDLLKDKKELENFYNMFNQLGVHYLWTLIHSKELLGFLGVSYKGITKKLNTEEIVLINMFSNQVASVLENITLYKEKIEKERLQRELDIAKEIQKSLLPEEFPIVKKCEIDAYSISCLEVGGDYYDTFIIGEDRIFFVIGDVSGKGAPAALLMAGVQSAIKSMILYTNDLVEINKNLNNIIYNNTKGKRFITFFSGILDLKDMKMYYINAGHNFPWLIKSDGKIYTLEEGGLLLGIMPKVDFKQGVIDIAPGDLVFLYTDGISEAFNKYEEEYSEERLVKVVFNNRQSNVRAIREAVLKDVRSFIGHTNVTDDMTMLILKIKE